MSDGPPGWCNARRGRGGAAEFSNRASPVVNGGGVFDWVAGAQAECEVIVTMGQVGGGGGEVGFVTKMAICA